MEEVAKSKMVGHELPEVLEGLDGKPLARKRLRQAALRHPIKLPLGMTTMLLESPFLRVASHPDFKTGISSEDLAKLAQQNTADLEWILANVLPTGGLDVIRERAIYSGLDQSGRIPSPFDWKGAVEHMLPLVGAEVEFAAHVIEQQYAPEDIEEVRRRAFELMRRVKPEGGR